MGRVWPRGRVTFPLWWVCAHSSFGNQWRALSSTTSGCLTPPLCPVLSPLPFTLRPQQGRWDRAPAQQAWGQSPCTSETLEELRRPCSASQTTTCPWCCEGKQGAGLCQMTLNFYEPHPPPYLSSYILLCVIATKNEKFASPGLSSYLNASV